MIEPNLSEDELWERVYESCIFNLSHLTYKIRSPEMHRVWDFKHYHSRIPIFVWDDFAVHSNKAVTQHETAWDHFKGGFDALGTKFGILIITLSTPEQPTSQIEHKYTHEVLITARGRYKYDNVIWQQDFRGWSAKHTKAWQQEAGFGEIPWCRFEPYDEQRVNLADEVLERIDNSMREKIGSLMRRLREDDIKVLENIVKLGPINDGRRKEIFAGENKQMEIKLKAHQLIVPVRRGTHSDLDITNYGLDVLEEWRKQQKQEDMQA